MYTPPKLDPDQAKGSDDGDDGIAAGDRTQHGEHQSSSIHGLAESVNSLHLQNHHETAIYTKRETADPMTALPDVNHRQGKINDEVLFESEMGNPQIHAESGSGPSAGTDKVEE
jgi:hypothetical protein